METRDDLWSAVRASWPDGLVAVGADGVIQAVNRLLCDMSGYAADELVGQPVEILLREHYRERHVELRRAFMAVHSSRLMGEGDLFRLRRHDGTTLPVTIALSVADLRSGTVALASVRDVSATQRQARRRAIVEAALDASSDGILVIHEHDLRRVYVNLAMVELTGYSRQEFASLDFGHALAYDEDRQRLAAALHATFADQEEPPSLVVRVRHRNGDLAWLELALSLIREADLDPDDARGRLVIVVARDISDRVAAEREARARSHATEVVAEVATRVLAGRPVDQTFGDAVAGMARSFESTTVVLYAPESADPGAAFRVVAVSGPQAELVRAGELLLDDEQLRALAKGEDREAREVDTERSHGLAAPFDGVADRVGVLVVFRPADEPVFSDADRELLRGIARQLSVAFELGRARADQEQLALLEQRQRIARDLHDTVIQDVVAAGMQLHADLRGSPESMHAERDAALVDQLDRAVRQLREGIGHLRISDASQSVSEDVLLVVGNLARTLGFQPSLRLEGPLNDLPRDLHQDLTAVLTECLSNVARHAGASSAWVEVTVNPDQLRVTVTDDGAGLPTGLELGLGLRNLAMRAATRGGLFDVERPAEGGTRIIWTAPRS
ncbi:MAG: PAS domain S-box protein [Nocardioidaceae bacterium]